jgi:hypothetical protein
MTLIRVFKIRDVTGYLSWMNLFSFLWALFIAGLSLVVLNWDPIWCWSFVMNCALVVNIKLDIWLFCDMNQWNTMCHGYLLADVGSYLAWLSYMEGLSFILEKHLLVMVAGIFIFHKLVKRTARPE